MQTGIRVQLFQQCKQFGLACSFSQNMRFGKNAEFRAGLFLATDIDFGSRVFANADERETGLHAALLQPGSAVCKFALDLRGNGAAVNYVVWGFCCQCV